MPAPADADRLESTRTFAPAWRVVVAAGLAALLTLAALGARHACTR
jgi:hypothetical protein